MPPPAFRNSALKITSIPHHSTGEGVSILSLANTNTPPLNRYLIIYKVSYQGLLGYWHLWSYGVVEMINLSLVRSRFGVAVLIQ